MLDNLPLPLREEIQNCLLCAGKDKDGLNLSLDPRKLWQVKIYNKSSVTNSSYELIFLKIRAKYEHFLNTSKIRAKIRVK